MYEMLVLRLEVQLRVECGKLEALADAEDALFAHGMQERVVLRLVPDAGRIAIPHAAREAEVSMESAEKNDSDAQVDVLEVDEVDEQRVVADTHQDVVLEAEWIVPHAFHCLRRQADEELLELLNRVVDLVDQLPQVLEQRQGRFDTRTTACYEQLFNLVLSR